jgi:hypothetical protein
MSFETMIFGVTQFISNLTEKVHLVVALLLFLVLPQKVMHHCICHTNFKQTQQLIDVILLESMSCRQRGCHPKLVVPVYRLHESVVSLDYNV